MLVDIQTTAEKGRVYTLKEPGGLRTVWRNKEPLTVPQGFKSDGASVPRFFWRFIFPKGDEKALRASFNHDFIYQTHPEGWTKAEADLLFFDLLIEDGVPKWRAGLAYKGVDWFGWRAWKTRGEC
jgi:hypothetical protein